MIHTSLGVVGFIIGSIMGQFAGAWTYLRTKLALQAFWYREIVSALLAGLVTALIATAVYVPLGVHIWITQRQDAPWAAAAFLGVCMGICQGVLFRDRPARSILEQLRDRDKPT